jgi:predicted amino acid racemase
VTAPRLELDLDKIEANARALVKRLGARGIAVTGVTKATLGSPEIALAFLRGGVRTLGDSRVENIERMRGEGIRSPMVLIRSPMLSQVERVVAAADVSLNTELDVIRRLSAAAVAAKRTHGVVLMVELGDLREGIMPGALNDLVRETLSLPGLALRGIGANLACQNGVVPDDRNMAELSRLADLTDNSCGTAMTLVSGGNSGNLEWARHAADVGRINDLRLGESILLGRETLQRSPVEGLHIDAITLVAEVIESKIKPSKAWGQLAETAFGAKPAAADLGEGRRAILALGRQDTDPDGLSAPAGLEIVGASSDHLVVVERGGTTLQVGDEVTFRPNYSALLCAMTSPYVTKLTKTAKTRDHGRPPAVPG